VLLEPMDLQSTQLVPVTLQTCVAGHQAQPGSATQLGLLA
jgi:hypothetical protein